MSVKPDERFYQFEKRLKELLSPFSIAPSWIANDQWNIDGIHVGYFCTSFGATLCAFTNGISDADLFGQTYNFDFDKAIQTWTEDFSDHLANHPLPLRFVAIFTVLFNEFKTP